MTHPEQHARPIRPARMDRQRRTLVRALGVLALSPLAAGPRNALAQKPGRTYRLGWLTPASTRTEPYDIAFTQRLAERGFIEGRNLEIVFRNAGGKPDVIPALAAELAQLKCNVIFAPGNEPALRVVRQAAPDVPIVIVAADFDPVATGHIARLARPGGNITGVSMLQTELPAKRLQVLTELVPKLRRAGVLADTSSAGQLQITRATAVQLGVELVVHEFSRAPYDFDAAFAAFKHAKVDALLALGSGYFVPARKLIPQLALQHRLPSVFHNALWAEQGGLLSYGANFSEGFRSAADLVAKVLNGANPGELPMEQSTIIEMVLNLKTARALKLVIPEAIRLRADRVIE